MAKCIGMRGILLLGLAILPAAVLADAGQGSLTGAYGNMLYYTNNFILVIAKISGFGLIVGSLVQFKNYRDNPLATRLSSVIWLLVIGLALLGLSYLPSPISSPHASAA